MKIERKQVKLDLMIHHLSHKCGLSGSMSKRVLHELIDFICLTLYQNKEEAVLLPRLGLFYLEETEENNKLKVKYQSSSFINNLINQTFDKNSEQNIDILQDSLPNLNSFNRLPIEEKQEPVQPLKAGASKLPKIENPTNTPDTVRSSFISYLQEEFIYGKSWTHPVTEQEFNKKQVQEALTIYKDYAPKLYNALRFLWVSQYNRANIAKHFNISSSSIRRCWNRAIDGVILIMLYPELEPGVCIKIYSSRK